VKIGLKRQGMNILLIVLEFQGESNEKLNRIFMNNPG